LRGVEEHRAGVAAATLADHFRAGALAPDFKLLDGRRAKRIGRAQQHRAPFIVEPLGQLADGGGLARAIHSHHQDHRGRLGHARRRPLAGLEDFEQLLADQALQPGRVAQLAPCDALPDALQDFVRGTHPDIGRDERGFQLVEQLRIDLFLSLEGVFERGNQPRARFLHAALQPLQQGWLLLHGAE
jgi:hypothetical protein